MTKKKSKGPEKGNEGVFVAGKPYASGEELISDLLPGFRLNIDELFINSDDED